jgi:co-chaperonin GroES (HSP10)
MNIAPTEFNVVVEIDVPPEKTAGGIILPQTATERDRLGADEGTLVAVSPNAFTYAEWPDDQQPPQVGQRVLIARYNGVLREVGGKTYRIVKDKDVVAVLRED